MTLGHPKYQVLGPAKLGYMDVIKVTLSGEPTTQFYPGLTLQTSKQTSTLDTHWVNAYSACEKIAKILSAFPAKGI